MEKIKASRQVQMPINIVALSIIFIFGFSFFSLFLQAERVSSFALVTLKNGGKQKFEYESFTLNWTLPITIKSQETCEEFEIRKDDIDEIYIINEFYNNCDDKDDWEVDVYLVDKRQILGFLNITEYAVRGRLYLSGEEKSIPFKDIKKVSFHR
jgi:hypothetical protein